MLYSGKGNNLYLNVSTLSIKPDTVYMDANYIRKGKIHGVLVQDGVIHNVSDAEYPCLIKTSDGDVTIKTNVTVNDLALSDFVIACAVQIFTYGKKTCTYGRYKTVISPLLHKKDIFKTILCILPQNKILIFRTKADLKELHNMCEALNVVSAVMLYSDLNFWLNTIGGVPDIMIENFPTTTLELKNAENLARPLIIIDPGHGGDEPGAADHYLVEKDLNLDIGMQIAEYLQEKYLCTVALTRNTDTTLSLSDRAKRANSIHADLFVSIHANAANNPEARGYVAFCPVPQVVLDKKYKESRRICTAIHEKLEPIITDEGMTTRGVKEANFHVLRETDMPAVLLENFFMSNLDDAKWLRREGNRRLLSRATALGIAEAVKLLPRIQDKDEEYIYTVQLGAYTTPQGAHELKDKLRDLAQETDLEMTKMLAEHLNDPLTNAYVRKLKK